MHKKVLIIEDDLGISEALTLILKENGFTPAAVNHGEEAYAKIASFKPQVIILDMLMSGQDGRHICKQLKADPITKNIPIIMTSAHPTASQDAVTCGADAFLAKPFDMENLLQVLAKYI